MEYNVEKEKREAIEAGQRALNNLQKLKNHPYPNLNYKQYLHLLIPY